MKEPQKICEGISGRYSKEIIGQNYIHESFNKIFDNFLLESLVEFAKQFLRKLSEQLFRISKGFVNKFLGSNT